MSTIVKSAVFWNAEDLAANPAWQFVLDSKARGDLLAAVRAAYDPDRSLFDYRMQDFDLGAAATLLSRAFEEVKQRCGVALVHGLPRDSVDTRSFELLTWAIGLHAGVARPQGKATQYISAVRDEGASYRTTKGRGYTSSAELDFHTDSSDIVVLSCYNRAASGGMSFTTSTMAARHGTAIRCRRVGAHCTDRPQPARSVAGSGAISTTRTGRRSSVGRPRLTR